MLRTTYALLEEKNGGGTEVHLKWERDKRWSSKKGSTYVKPKMGDSWAAEGQAKKCTPP